MKNINRFFCPENYRACNNCKYQPEPLRMCRYGETLDHIEVVCKMWEERIEWSDDIEICGMK